MMSGYKNSLCSEGLNDCYLYRFRKSGINDSWRSMAIERRKLLMKTMAMIMNASCFMVPHSYQQLYRKDLMRDMLTLVACLEQVNIFYNKKKKKILGSRVLTSSFPGKASRMLVESRASLPGKASRTLIESRDATIPERFNIHSRSQAR